MPLLGIVAAGAVLVLATGTGAVVVATKTGALDGVEQQAAEEQSTLTMDVVPSGVEDA
ncbi:hypothetical protein [Haloterrigena alkaliphila]|uniref:Uncharacterized protein n=1 Tax=Haloterrigena alkaliphila TaxID=2816475 RepID=A0A8A2VDR4_9EURY|nr:hypothetical protein [Haloterrigena alkaliphila]QSW98522.1 hypothetical protein J0X25_14115 [Haloterrigena alkaliphila]